MSKVKWLIDLVSNPECGLHLQIFKELLGVQKGGICGRDLMFLDQTYMKRHLKTDSAFYKEALQAMSTLHTSKGIPNVHCWDAEHLFYNKYFTVRDTEKNFYNHQTLRIQRNFNPRKFPRREGQGNKVTAT